MRQKLNLFLVAAALMTLTACSDDSATLLGDDPSDPPNPPAPTSLSGGAPRITAQMSRPTLSRPTVKVAEPGSAPLAATGLLTLAGLAGVRRRKNKY